MNGTIIKNYYQTSEAAVEAVRLGHAWGAVYFTDNFTDALVARMALGMFLFLKRQSFIFFTKFTIFL